MAKRKKTPKKKRGTTLRKVIGIVKKPGATYKCLECDNRGPAKEMLISATVGDHEMPNGRVVPGKATVRAPVCRFCHEERMKADGRSEEGTGSPVPQ